MKSKTQTYKKILNNLHVGDNDLIGRSFNGHDLHLKLRDRGINSSHLVWNKQSDDNTSFVIGGDKKDIDLIKNHNDHLHNIYSLTNAFNPLTFDILYSELFLKSDIVHYHLIHNLNFDMRMLPILTRLKPSVLSLHDPWFFGGHCIHPNDCKKWETYCYDCPYVNSALSLQTDNSLLNFELKKMSLIQSNLSVIAGSKWVMKMAMRSPLFKNKNIYHVPYGIDQTIFRILNKAELRNKYGISKNAIVIFFRNTNNQFKGIDYIEYFIKNLITKKEIIFITVESKFINEYNGYRFLHFGWINNNHLLSELFNLSDIFLMPSKMETFGLMAAEAMSCGVVPAVLNGTGLPETVNAPTCGLSSERIKEKYLESVELLINNDDIRKKRSELCLKFANKTYDYKKYLDRILEVYQTTIKTHSLSEIDKKLIQQITKYNLIKPQLYFIQDVIRNKLMKMNIFKRNFLNIFYIIDKVIPKIYRTKIKKNVLKIPIFYSLFKN